MFKVINENKIVGISEERPNSAFLSSDMEIVEDTEHPVSDYMQVNGEFVLASSTEAIEQKQAEIRAVRNSYLVNTDKYMISDFPITDEERAKYRDYRQYLRDYPETEEDWYERNPLTFEEWKETIQEPIEQEENESEVSNG